MPGTDRVVQPLAIGKSTRNGESIRFFFLGGYLKQIPDLLTMFLMILMFTFFLHRHFFVAS